MNRTTDEVDRRDGACFLRNEEDSRDLNPNRPTASLAVGDCRVAKPGTSEFLVYYLEDLKLEHFGFFIHT